jgi:predicted nucleotide-binding protein
MAGRRQQTPEPPVPPALNVPRSEAARILTRHADEGKALVERAEPVAVWKEWGEAFDRWRAVTETALRRIYTTEQLAVEFRSASGHIFRRIGQSDDETFEYQRDVIAKGVNILLGFVDALEYVEAPDDAEPITVVEAEAKAYSRDVFVVHGRDEGMRESVARILERLGFGAIILADQPNQGATIIEKFERNAINVGFAVVLMSPDDYGRNPEDADFPGEPNRARQNVVLELGYFMGALGRPRVVALYKRGTELPSDIHGLAYVPFDEGGAWKFKLAQELAAADYDVDFNRLK